MGLMSEAFHPKNPQEFSALTEEPNINLSGFYLEKIFILRRVRVFHTAYLHFNYYSNLCSKGANPFQEIDMLKQYFNKLKLQSEIFILHDYNSFCHISAGNGLNLSCVLCLSVTFFKNHV